MPGYLFSSPDSYEYEGISGTNHYCRNHKKSIVCLSYQSSLLSIIDNEPAKRRFRIFKEAHFCTADMFFKKKVDEGKAKQIRDLRSSFPSLRRPHNDDSVFEMLFEVDKAYSTLRIYIHPDFPNSKPGLIEKFSDVLQLFQDVIH